MENRVIVDPKDCDSYRVVFNGKLCSPNFNSSGAAKAYLNMLIQCKREPEYQR